MSYKNDKLYPEIECKNGTPILFGINVCQSVTCKCKFEVNLQSDFSSKLVKIVGEYIVGAGNLAGME